MSAVAVAWAEALLASLWQAPIVALLAGLVELAWARRSTTRHAIRAVALMSVPGLVVGTALGLVPDLASPRLAVGLVGPGPGPAPAPAPWVTWILSGWLLGVSLLSVRTLGQWRRVRGLRRAARPLPEVWQARVRSLARALGMRPPAVAMSDRCDAPLLLGLWRPLVLLPMGLLNGVPPAVVEAALAHELMHLRRLDPWLHAAQVVTELLLFFNPAVWWMSWRLSVEREHACDEAVLAARGQPALPYARALVALETWRQHPAPALTLGLGGPSLRGRVLRLVQPRTLGPAARWGARVGVVLVLVTVVGLLVREPAPRPPVAALDPIGVAWLPDDVRRHQDAITEAAARHGVDPGLLAIVVWAESRGRADARSPLGARGLMQLMPTTAAEIAEHRGLSDHAPRRLDEPAYNLDLGAWYLARQLDHYGQLPVALAAYNAGPGRVEAWTRGEATLPEETRRYQATIMALWAERGLPWSPTLAMRDR